MFKKSMLGHYHPYSTTSGIGVQILLAAALLVSACASIPEQDSMAVLTPTALPPELDAAVVDKRGRFREIACEVLETSGRDLPHYAPCEEVLRNFGEEGGATGAPVSQGKASRPYVAALVPGIGWECFENWLDIETAFDEYFARLGIRTTLMRVDGLSGSGRNADMIYQAFKEKQHLLEHGQVVLIGYSKGAPDILEALVRYPEIRPYIAAMVSVSGAVRGSPLANDASERALGLLKYMPDSDCTDGDGEAIHSLMPATRIAWLENNPLPDGIRYYSVVTVPTEERVSNVLHGTYRDLAVTDPRNDSQVIFSDQVIPGSTLVAYLNADHWAISVPIMESHPTIGKLFVDQNAFPRQALAEALLRFIDEDLAVADQDRNDH